MSGQTSISNPVGDPEQLILVEEISHRVVNEYSAVIATISLAAAQTPDTAARAVLRCAAGQLRRYAAAHRALQRPVADDMVDLGSHLECLCSALCEATLRDRAIKLVLHTEVCALASDRCWKVGLICAELITNSVRHGLRGRPGVITLRVASAAGHIYCSITDDGGNTERGKLGLGSYVVQGLARQLGGQVEWRFGAKGAEALLSFPAALSQSMI